MKEKIITLNAVASGGSGNYTYKFAVTVKDSAGNTVATNRITVNVKA